MAASFATYASQFLRKNNSQEQGSSSSSEQPMFFSFTTAGGELEGLDEEDPHLLDTGYDDDDSPFGLQESTSGKKRGGGKNRMTASELLRESDRGWLAHQNGDSSSSSDDDSDEEEEPERRPPRTLAVHSESLTYSLLPRDPNLFVFSLPDPRSRRRLKYNDSAFTAMFLGSVTLCFVLTIILLFVPSSNTGIAAKLAYKTLIKSIPLLVIVTLVSAVVSYVHVWLLSMFVRPVMIGTSLLVPVSMFICTIWAFVASFMWEDGTEPTWGETTGLRLFSLIPLTLTILSSRRLLSGSLLAEINTTSKILSLTTNSILMPNPHLLVLSPLVLLLTLLVSIPFITLLFRLVLLGGRGNTRLEYHLYAYSTWAIVFAIAVWLWCFGVARGVIRVTTAGVVGAWYHSWAPNNHLTLGGEEEAGYSYDYGYDTRAIHASLHRSLHPTFGTICLAGLFITLLRMLSLLSLSLTFMAINLPIWFPSLRIATTVTRAGFGYILMRSLGKLISIIEGFTESISKETLIYVGLDGSGFWESTRGLMGLHQFHAQNPSRNRVLKRTNALKGLNRTLDTSTYTLSFPFSLLTFLVISHFGDQAFVQLEALVSAILAGITSSLVSGFCNAVVRDCAETVWVCYLLGRRERILTRERERGRERIGIDEDTEEKKRRKEEVVKVFEGDEHILPVSTRTRQKKKSKKREEQYPSSQIPYDVDEESISDNQQQQHHHVRPTPPVAPPEDNHEPVTLISPSTLDIPIFRSGSIPHPSAPSPITIKPRGDSLHTTRGEDEDEDGLDGLGIGLGLGSTSGIGEEDVNPFDTTGLSDDEEGEPHIPMVRSGASVGTGAGASVSASATASKKDADGDDDDDLYPGSGFF